jgi:hypothetical protein
MTQLWEVSIQHDPYAAVENRRKINITRHIVVTAKNNFPTVKEIRAQIGYPRLVDGTLAWPLIDPPGNSPDQSMYPYIFEIKMISK